MVHKIFTYPIGLRPIVLFQYLCTLVLNYTILPYIKLVEQRRFELLTFSVQRNCAPVAPLPHRLVERMGIEPTTRSLQKTVAPLVHAPPLNLVGVTRLELARTRIKSPVLYLISFTPTLNWWQWTVTIRLRKPFQGSALPFELHCQLNYS